ncbi:hypothetical protein [Enterococcus mundtii]
MADKRESQKFEEPFSFFTLIYEGKLVEHHIFGFRKHKTPDRPGTSE